MKFIFILILLSLLLVACKPIQTARTCASHVKTCSDNVHICSRFGSWCKNFKNQCEFDFFNCVTNNYYKLVDANFCKGIGVNRLGACNGNNTSPNNATK